MRDLKEFIRENGGFITFAGTIAAVITGGLFVILNRFYSLAQLHYYIIFIIIFLILIVIICSSEKIQRNIQGFFDYFTQKKLFDTLQENHNSVIKKLSTNHDETIEKIDTIHGGIIEKLDSNHNETIRKLDYIENFLEPLSSISLANQFLLLNSMEGDLYIVHSHRTDVQKPHNSDDSYTEPEIPKDESEFFLYVWHWATLNFKPENVKRKCSCIMDDLADLSLKNRKSLMNKNLDEIDTELLNSVMPHKPNINTIFLNELKNSINILKSNLIVIGCPSNNNAAKIFEEILVDKNIIKFRFVTENISGKTGSTNDIIKCVPTGGECEYRRDEATRTAYGLITRIKNPYNDKKFIILVQGGHREGQMAITKHITRNSNLHELVRDYENDQLVISGEYTKENNETSILKTEIVYPENIR